MEINLHRLGLDLRWSGKSRRDYLAIKDHNKKLWQNWKEEHGYNNNTPLEDIPGFMHSIERLHDAGYGFIDIGLDYGMTGERIRKLFVKYSLKHNSLSERTMYRDWSDVGNRFIAVPPQEKTHQLFDRFQKYREARKQKELTDAREKDIRVIVRLMERNNGRQPTLLEITKKRGYSNYQSLGAHWNHDFNSMFDAANIRRVETRGRTPRRRKN